MIVSSRTTHPAGVTRHRRLNPHAVPAAASFPYPTRNLMVVTLIGTAAALMLVGAIVITLERHQRLTVVTGAIVAVSAAAIVAGSALGAVAILQPASATTPAPKFNSENSLPERIVDVQLPTL
jgi:hypothetical protein